MSRKQTGTSTRHTAFYSSACRNTPTADISCTCFRHHVNKDLTCTAKIKILALKAKVKYLANVFCKYVT